MAPLRRVARPSRLALDEKTPLFTQSDTDKACGDTVKPQDKFQKQASATDQDLSSGPDTDDVLRPLKTPNDESLDLEIGDIVELNDGDFIRLTTIAKHRWTKERIFCGLRFRRASGPDRYLDGHLNELVLLLTCKEGDERHMLRKSIEPLTPNQVVRKRQIICTNLHYPHLSCLETNHADARRSSEWISSYGVLICRWKFWSNGKNDGLLQSLRREECDDDQGLDEEVLRFSFRDATIKGGSCPNWLPGEEQYNIHERERCNYNDPLEFYPDFESLTPDSRSCDLNQEHSSQYEFKLHRYTFGDGFCGAGGVSRGAKGAGLRVIWGFDFNPAAIESFVQNFHGTHCWLIAAHELLTVIKDDLKVDILHLSPPCKTFSPAHTRLGKDDEMNQATFLAIRELIIRARPRIVTLEETFGLTRTTDNLLWFQAMIQMFTGLGFSVRWKVFDFRDFGLPQPRKRLFVYAAW